MLYSTDQQDSSARTTPVKFRSGSGLLMRSCAHIPGADTVLIFPQIINDTRKESHIMETLPPDQPDSAPTTTPRLTLDVAYYQAYLDSPHYSDSEKREMVEALWRIISTFVDLGFGIHPAQQTDAEICGKDEHATSHADPQGVDSHHIQRSGGAS